MLAAPMDSVMSPSTAVEIGRLGGVGVLDLDGLWTRYEDPLPLLEEIVRAPDSDITSRLQQIYSAPIRDELIGQRLEEMRVAGVTVAGRLSPAADPTALANCGRGRDRAVRHSWLHGVCGTRLKQK